MPQSNQNPCMPPEFKLLILCSRTIMEPGQTAELRDLAKRDLNWDTLVKMAIKHGVTSLVYWNLNAICAEFIPSDILTFLRQNFQANALRGRLVTQELVRLVEAASSQGITLIPFKGPTLAIMAYGDLFLRNFGDMDIIVAQHSISNAYKCLLSQGYQLRHGASCASEKKLRSQRHHIFVKADGSVRVDLQWLMAGRESEDFSFQLDRACIWENLRSVDLQGKPVMNLSPEDLLVILCVHGSKHAWEELKWICDVAELMRTHQEINWEWVMKNAAAWRCRRMLFLGLALAHSFFAVKLPYFLSQKIASDRIVQLLMKVIQESLIHTSKTIDKKDYPAVYFLLKDRWWDRCLFGLYLCRSHSSVLRRPPSWFPSQPTLILASKAIQPLHKALKKSLESLKLKKTVVPRVEEMT